MDHYQSEIFGSWTQYLILPLLKLQDAIFTPSQDRLNRRLENAILSGQELIAVYAIHKGADPDYRGEDGKTPVIVSAANGGWFGPFNKIVKALIDAHADLTATSSLGVNARGMAMYKCFGEICFMIDQASPKKAFEKVCPKMTTQQAMTNNMTGKFNPLNGA